MEMSERLFTGASEASQPAPVELTFSICTITNDYSQYQAMLESFEHVGFNQGNCEFLYIDNVHSNKHDCYEGLNLLIQRSVGKYILMCHQDIRLLSDSFKVLTDRLNELDSIDPQWAVAGNAGKTIDGDYRIRISDLHGIDQSKGPLPAQVVSLDENFIVMKRSALLAFSTDLQGFHLYGTDICIQAEVRGRSVYVIDFHLEHLSAGTVGEDFFACADALEWKYLRAFKRRWVNTPSTRVVVGAQRWELYLRAVKRARKRRKILARSE